MVPADSFRSGKAPCGRVVNGQTYQDQDEEVLITQEQYYACGCVRIRHEYHDGSVAERVVHHNGSVLLDELLAAE